MRHCCKSARNFSDTGEWVSVRFRTNCTKYTFSRNRKQGGVGYCVWKTYIAALSSTDISTNISPIWTKSELYKRPFRDTGGESPAPLVTTSGFNKLWIAPPVQSYTVGNPNINRNKQLGWQIKRFWRFRIYGLPARRKSTTVPRVMIKHSTPPAALLLAGPDHE